MTVDLATVRRRVAVRLGLLGIVILLAGLLPWITWGALTTRLVALPLVLAGLACAGLAGRSWAVARPAAAAVGSDRSDRSDRPAGCGKCTCGGGGCGETGK